MRRWAAVAALASLAAPPLGDAPALAQEAGVERTVPAPAARPAATVADEVMVHIDTRAEAAGLARTDLGAARCPAPCDQAFPRQGVYQITGPGLIPSDAFQLPARATAVALDVDAGMQAQKTAGAVMGIGGIVLTTAGLVTSTLLALETIDGPPASAFQKDLSLGATLGGLASTAIGALLYFTAGTRVRSKGAPLRLVF